VKDQLSGPTLEASWNIRKGNSPSKRGNRGKRLEVPKKHKPLARKLGWGGLAGGKKKNLAWQSVRQQEPGKHRAYKSRGGVQGGKESNQTGGHSGTTQKQNVDYTKGGGTESLWGVKKRSI